MRIRDWSSYMYSSDLQAPTRRWQTPCRSYDFPQNGAHRAGIGANDAERERDQFVPPGRHVIEHEPLQYPHIDRLDRLMRIERLRLFGVERGRASWRPPSAAEARSFRGLLGAIDRKSTRLNSSH